MLCLAFLQEPPTRTAAIYRLPAVEGESRFFERFVEESEFDTVCIEPAPGPNARRLAAGKLRFVAARTLDTRANVRWRNATMEFVNGRISPREWLRKTRGLGETVHFLSYPKAPSLREATGRDTGRAVFAEIFVLSLPGRPCFTADDIGATRSLPGPGALQSWFLAMNDLRGPMLYGRSENYDRVAGPLTVVRADSKPGLFAFRLGRGKGTTTFYFNNGPSGIPLAGIDMNQVGGVMRRVDLEGKQPALMPQGFLTVHGA